MAWGARCGPNFGEVRQARIEKRSDRVQVADRGHAANGKASLRPHEVCIGTAQRFARKCGGFVRADSVPACGQEQDRLARGFALKDDRFGNLVDGAASGLCGLGGGAGFAQFDGRDVEARVMERFGHAFQALAHLFPRFAFDQGN